MRTTLLVGTPILIILIHLNVFCLAFDCNEIRSDSNIKFHNWETLQKCIITIGKNKLDANSSHTIWQLIKNANDGLDNIAPSVYKNMGNILPGIPLNDLQNITFDIVEIVKAFGSIREGFSEEQLKLIAKKVGREWSNKSPNTYSEYDLISMGQIVCYLKPRNILAIHADAFRYAAEWIGNLDNCPADRIQAFAQLAVQRNAFGPPSNWSKLDVSILGNVVKGLNPSEIQAIGKDKLRLNKHFRMDSSNASKSATNNDFY